MAPISMILSNLWPTFKGYRIIIDALEGLDVLCVQLMHDLFAIAKFLLPII